MIWVVAHDSGGAEILSAWVKRNAGEHFRFVLEGPALKVFERKLPDVSVATRADLESADPKADWILTGTGWASDLEFEAIRIARRKGVRVVSFLDHWVNYIERFTRKGLVSLPDEIWVGDEDALKIAKERFQTRVAIRLEPNPYFDEIREELKKVTKSGGASSKSGIRILYVCEALSEHLRAKGELKERAELPEFTAIRRFLDWMTEKHADLKVDRLRFRLHPAESPTKYSALLESITEYPIEVSPSPTLLEDCAWSDWVVGMASMGLVIGILAGKKVFSSMPPGFGECPLPQKEIERIPSGER